MLIVKLSQLKSILNSLSKLMFLYCSVLLRLLTILSMPLAISAFSLWSCKSLYLTIKKLKNRRIIAYKQSLIGKRRKITIAYVTYCMGFSQGQSECAFIADQNYNLVRILSK